MVEQAPASMVLSNLSIVWRLLFSCSTDIFISIYILGRFSVLVLYPVFHSVRIELANILREKYCSV